MNKNMTKAVVGLFADVLSLLESEEERGRQIKEFDEVFGAKVNGWENLIKEKLA